MGVALRQVGEAMRPRCPRCGSKKIAGEEAQCGFCQLTEEDARKMIKGMTERALEFLTYMTEEERKLFVEQMT